MKYVVTYRGASGNTLWTPPYRADTVNDVVEQFQANHGKGIPFSIYEVKPVANVAVTVDVTYV